MTTREPWFADLPARFQFWLQGHPNKRRPRPVVWLGNRLSDLRYWTWRLRGGERRDAHSHPVPRP